eukprot:COSAG02_NODE_4_length_69935_cov_46.806590_47_plen_154_part_00
MLGRRGGRNGGPVREVRRMPSFLLCACGGCCGVKWGASQCGFLSRWAVDPYQPVLFSSLWPLSSSQRRWPREPGRSRGTLTLDPFDAVDRAERINRVWISLLPLAAPCGVKFVQARRSHPENTLCERAWEGSLWGGAKGAAGGTAHGLAGRHQ